MNNKIKFENNAKTKYIKTDIMRFKKNNFSFWFAILAIVFNVAMFLIIYKETNCTPNFQLGIDLLINVLFMLTGFLLAEKMKAYNKTSGIIALVLGVVEMLRIFWIPLYYFNKNIEYLAAYNAAIEAGETFSYSGIIGLNANEFMWCAILLVLAGLSLILAGLICLKKEKTLTAHLNDIKGAK